MTDFLDVKRREISDRLKELKPAVDEYSRLEAAASALAKVGAATPAATPWWPPPPPPLPLAAGDRDARAAPAKRLQPAPRPPKWDAKK